MLTRKQLLAKISKEKKAGTFKGFDHQKQFSIKAISGVEVIPEILTEINKFTIAPLSAEQVYVRKFLLAHNCVDRDRERFPEALLEDFSSTLPGKSFLVGHSRSGPGKGLFFSATTEEMTPEQFKALTGEEPRLGEGITTVKVLWAWMYMLQHEVDETNKEAILNIDAGIYRHVSIGFRASDMITVKGPFEQILYWEYVAPGEALEGSLVWLGAQPGATAQKQFNDSSDMSDMSDSSYNAEGGIQMKGLFKALGKLFPGMSFTEEGIADEIKDAIESLKQKAAQALEEVKAALTAKTTEAEGLAAKVKELTPLAEEGKAYRASLCDQYVASKKKLGDIDDAPESAVKAREIAGTFGIDFLKSELVVLEKRVHEKFPDKSELRGKDDANGKRADGGAKKNHLTPKE